MNDLEMLQKFGERLVQARTMRGMSQRELSDLANLSNAMVNKYEKGLTDPGATNLIKLARILNVEPSWLMAWDDAPATPEFVSNSVQHEFEKYGVVKPGEKVDRALLDAAMPAARAIAESLRQLRNK